MLGNLFPFKAKKGDITPTISIIIPAYNEAKHIERKIENTLALSYPSDKAEILVGSDGSTDETAAIVNKFRNRSVRLIEYKANRGKTAVQNELFGQSKGEILIFTDAASFLESSALKEIVKYFADERIGCVAGQMRFLDTDSSLTKQSQGLYWRYEIKIRQIESSLGSLIGVDGPLYAVRRNAYVTLKPETMSDFITPLLVLAHGKKVLLASNAFVDEATKTRAHDEFTTRRRITLRGLNSLSAYKDLINPTKHFRLAVQIFFHKILRWFVGPLVMLNILSCCALVGHWFFEAILAAYGLFFLSAGAGWIGERLKIRGRMLTLPYYFSLGNLALTAGILDFYRRKSATTWEPVRE
jgi:cellulose synthase/poly-beta-1,6-N-acetylglucosamine synthase-like glycosyltransferase